jgi:hypothetical protein
VDARNKIYFELKKLFKIALELKRYLWQKLKPGKTQNVNKTITKKQVDSSILKTRTTTLAIDDHMVVFQVQIGKNTIKDVLLDRVYGVNMITK